MSEPGGSTRRRLLCTAAAVACASAVGGAAATLGGAQTQSLGTGHATVASCDADGVSVAYTVTAGSVESIDVGGLASACAGGALRAVLADSAGASIGSGGPQTVAGTSVTVVLTPQPQANDVAGVHVVVEGQ